MKWRSRNVNDTEAYWDRIYVPAHIDVHAYDYVDPPYVVILVNDAPYISPNTYRLESDRDIGPFESVEKALAAAEMLNAQEGWTE